MLKRSWRLLQDEASRKSPTTSLQFRNSGLEQPPQNGRKPQASVDPISPLPTIPESFSGICRHIDGYRLTATESTVGDDKVQGFSKPIWSFFASTAQMYRVAGAALAYKTGSAALVEHADGYIVTYLTRPEHMIKHPVVEHSKDVLQELNAALSSASDLGAAIRAAKRCYNTLPRFMGREYPSSNRVKRTDQEAIEKTDQEVRFKTLWLRQNIFGELHTAGEVPDWLSHFGEVRATPAGGSKLPFEQLLLSGVKLPGKQFSTGARPTLTFLGLNSRHLESNTSRVYSIPQHQTHRMDGTWSQAFATINAFYRADLPWPNGKVPRALLDLILQEGNSLEEFSSRGYVRQLWSRKDLQWKSTHWQPALLLALLRSPLEALGIAHEAYVDAAFPLPSCVVQDVLDHVVTAELEYGETPEREIIQTIVDSACLFLRKDSGGISNITIRERTAYTLLEHCDLPQLDALWCAMERAELSLKTYTKTHVIKRYIQLDKLGSALEILQRLTRKEMRHIAAAKICTILLRAPWEIEDLYGLRCKMLSFMLEIGLVPNKHIHNVILLNAMEAGDRKMAWQYYHIMKQNKAVPTAHTYSILLKGVDSGDDLNAISSVYNEAKSDALLHSDLFLATHFLNALYTFYRSREQSSFGPMLRFYVEFFDLSPLVDLGIIEQEAIPIDQPPKAFEAGDRALAWMIIAWLNENATHPARVHRVYERFLEHTSKNHPLITPLTTETFVANAFILAFGRNRSSLHMCTTVAQNMLKPPSLSDDPAATDSEDTVDLLPPQHIDSTTTGENNEAPSTTDTQPTQLSPILTSAIPQPPPAEDDYYDTAPPIVEEETPHHRPPNSWTWNCLLLVFAWHRQVEAAENIMVLMKAHGVEPDKVSWEHLINGYAREQDLEGVVDAVRRMGKERWQPDEWTQKHLSRFQDRIGLLAGLEESARQDAAEADSGEQVNEEVGD